MSSSAIRDEVRSLGKHSSVYVIGQALSRLVGFLMVPIYTRFISPADYGAFDLIEMLTGMAAVVMAMGVAEAMPRFYYATNDQVTRNTTISTIIAGLALLGIPVVCLFMAAAGFFARTVLAEAEQAALLQIGFAAVWFGLLCEIGYSYLRMLYRAKLFVVLTAIQLVTALSLNVYFVVFLNWDIRGILLSTLITQSLLGALMSAVILSKVGLRVSPRLLWRLVAFGFPLVPARIGQAVGFASSRLFLRWFGASHPAAALAQVGILSLGTKFALVVDRFANVPFNAFWSPRRLELVAQHGPGAKETVARICTYAMFFSTFVALLLCAGIESVIQIMADPRYHGAHVVVPLLALANIGAGLEPHLTTGLVHRGKTIWLTGIGLVSLAVTLTWNYLLIPHYGILGAATSNLAGLVVRLVLIRIAGQAIYAIPFELYRIVLLVATASGLYFLSQFITLSSVYATLVARLTIAMCFPIALLGVGFYYREELRFFAQLLRRGQAAILGESMVDERS